MGVPVEQNRGLRMQPRQFLAGSSRSGFATPTRRQSGRTLRATTLTGFDHVLLAVSASLARVPALGQPVARTTDALDVARMAPSGTVMDYDLRYRKAGATGWTDGPQDDRLTRYCRFDEARRVGSAMRNEMN